MAIATGGNRTPWPVALLIAAFLCPTEFSLYLDGLRLPPHRVALLLLLPLALWRLLAQRNLKFRAFDAFFILFNVWTVGVFMHHQGAEEGLAYGGSLALESLGAYLVARTWVRSIQDFDGALRAMGIAIVAAALIALPETLLGQTFTHDALRDLTGYQHPTRVETRVGLTRAYGTFDHPIHYGAFCAALMAMFWFAAKNVHEARKRVAWLTGAAILGLSAAPILCLLLQGGMLVWEKATRGVASRTSLSLAALVGLYIGASLALTRSPINLIATGLTFDSWTGYYRLQIWEHGLSNVAANPWFGIGLSDWARPWWMASSTIDAFWLVVAVREGAPGFALLVLAVALLARRVVTRGLRNPDVRIRHLSRGWIMSLIALSLIGCTVHFWNVLYAFFFFVVGLGGWLGDPARLRSVAEVQPQRLHRRKISPKGRRHAYPVQLRPIDFGYPALRPLPA
ncbi:MAG: O-antigen ligase family protein [Hyphomicrobium sp.]